MNPATVGAQLQQGYIQVNLPRISTEAPANGHSHVFLGGHERNERRTWIVVVPCAVRLGGLSSVSHLTLEVTAGRT